MNEIETDRLLLRRWRNADREPFARMNADPAVMKHFLLPVRRVAQILTCKDPRWSMLAPSKVGFSRRRRANSTFYTFIYTFECVNKVHMEKTMGTNLAIDDDLIEEARRIGGHPTKKQAVTVALQEYVARRKQMGIIDLFGTIDFDPAYN